MAKTGEHGFPSRFNVSEHGNRTTTESKPCSDSKDDGFGFKCSRCGTRLLGTETEGSPVIDDVHLPHPIKHRPFCGVAVLDG